MFRQTIATEWLRLRSRREIVAVLLLVPVLVSLQYGATVSSLIAQSKAAPGTVLPLDVVQFNEMSLARYQSPQSIPTVLGDAIPILMAAAVLLTCLSVGSEFGSGTVRTGVVFSASRIAYLRGRLAGSLGLGMLPLVLVVATAAILPWAAGLFGVTLRQAEPVTLPGLTLVLAVFLLVIAACTTAALSLTVLSRSSMLGVVAFGGLVFVDAALRRLGAGSALLPFWPGQAIADLLNGTLTVAGAVSAPTPLGSSPVQSEGLRAALALACWTAALFAAAVLAFRTRDISE